MKAPDGYETVRVIRRTAIGGAAWVRSEAGGPLSVFKWLNPAPFVWDERRVTRRVSRFVARAEHQQRLASAGSGQAAGWATITKFGSDERSAWAVMPGYGLSVQALTRSGTGVDAYDLHRIVTDVLQTLVTSQIDGGSSSGSGSAHGAMTLSNVLLTSVGGKVSAVLTDPLHPKELEAQAKAGRPHADARAIGALICALASGEAFRRGRWPLAMSVQWQGLGRHGDGWRELANELLNPEPSVALPALELIAERVERLKPVSKGAVRGAWAGAGLAAAAGLTTLAILLMPSEEPETFVPFNAVAWTELCDATYTWLGPLSDRLDAGVRDRWSADPYLAQNVMGLIQRQSLDPRDIIGSQAGLLELRDAPPSGARTAEAVEKTAEASAALDALESSLSPDSWPLLGEIEARATRFEALGWGGPGALLRRSVQPFNEAFDGSLFEHIDAAVQIGATSARIESDWSKVEAAAEAVGESDVPMLTRFREATLVEINPLLSSSTTGDLERLASTLDESASLAGQLDGFIDGEWRTLVDRERFMEQGTINRQFASGELDGPLDTGVFRSWLLEASRPEYRAISADDDPRDERRWQGELSSARRAISILARDFPRDVEADLPTLRARVSEMETELAGLVRMELTVETVDSVRSVTDDFEVRLNSLVDATSGLLDRLESYDDESGAEYRRSLRARGASGVSPSGSDVLDAMWQREVSSLLRQFQTDAGYRELRRRAEGLERFISVSDGALATRVPRLGRGEPSAWFERFSIEAARVKRESLFEPLMSGLEFDDRGMPTDAPAMAAALERASTELDAWLGRAAELARDASAAERRLDTWHRYNEEGPAGRSAAELLEGWRSDPLWTDRAIRAGMGEAQDRLDRYASDADDATQIEREADAAFEKDDPLLWVAWQRLGKDGTGWPASVDALRRDAAYAQRLSAGLGLIAQDDRRSTLRSQFDQRLRNGWVRCFETLTRADDIREASALAQDFGVDIDVLGTRSQFNLAIGRLSTLTRELDEDAVASSVLVSVRSLRNIEQDVGASVAERAAATEAIVALTSLVPEDGSRVAFDSSVFDTLGPASVDGLGLSAAAVAPDGSWVDYSGGFDRASGRVTLRFERIDDPDGVLPSFYMSVDEVPLRVFGAAARKIYGAEARRSGLALALEQVWPDLVSETWVGPRLWSYSRGSARFSLNSDSSRGGLMPTPQLIDAPRLVVDDPSVAPAWEMPMQAVSPAACELWALALGCRLPTAEEWNVANRASPTAQPNIRDQAWARQRDFVAQGRSTGLPLPWPTDGGFASANESAATAPVAGTDDGYVFFAPVDTAGAGARNLVGNVAEVVYTQDPDEGELAIIGGSALSPPSADVTEPRPVRGADRTLARADIGLRLVIPLSDAGGALRPLSSQLAEVLEEVAFLSAR